MPVTRERIRQGADQFARRSATALGRPPARDPYRDLSQALDHGGNKPERTTGILTRPASPLPGGTPPELQTELDKHLAASRDLQDALTRMLSRKGGPRVLETRTFTIPASGVYEQGHFRVPYSSIAILNPNQSPGQSVTVYGTQTNIVGSTVIASIPNASLLAVAPLGTLWQVAWSVALRGTITAADAANMDLDSPVGTLKLKGMYPGAVGSYPQTTLNIAPGSNGLSVVTPGAASSAAAIYDAEISATPLNNQAAALIVSSGAANGTAPGGGQGQFSVPPQSFVALPMTGSALSIYGTPGAVVSYVAMVDRVQPIAAKLV